MEQITFEQLPKAVEFLIAQVGELEKLIRANNDSAIQAPDTFLNIQDAALYLGLTVPTIYRKVSSRCIPSMKRGKRLYFSTEDLKAYIQGGKMGPRVKSRLKSLPISTQTHTRTI